MRRLLLIPVVLLCACRNTEVQIFDQRIAGGAPLETKTLKIAVARRLDATDVEGESPGFVTRLVHAFLFRIGPEGLPRADLAEALTEDAEGVSRIVLRPAAFHDGRPVTARDVVASLERSGSLVEGARAVASAEDERTLVVRAPQRDPWLAERLTRIPIRPAEPGDDPLLGAGPYRLERRDPGAWLFASHDAYHGERSRNRRLLVVYEPSERFRAEGVLAGAFHLAVVSDGAVRGPLPETVRVHRARSRRLVQLRATGPGGLPAAAVALARSLAESGYSGNGRPATALLPGPFPRIPLPQPSAAVAAGDLRLAVDGTDVAAMDAARAFAAGWRTRFPDHTLTIVAPSRGADASLIARTMSGPFDLALGPLVSRHADLGDALRDVARRPRVAQQATAVATIQAELVARREVVPMEWVETVVLRSDRVGALRWRVLDGEASLASVLPEIPFP